MGRFILGLLPMVALGCSNFRYSAPKDATPEFYQVKAQCEREAYSLGSASGSAVAQLTLDQREYFLTCMKAHGY